jgi:hypothetical protein
VLAAAAAGRYIHAQIAAMLGGILVLVAARPPFGQNGGSA